MAECCGSVLWQIHQKQIFFWRFWGGYSMLKLLSLRKGWCDSSANSPSQLSLALQEIEWKPYLAFPSLVVLRKKILFGQVLREYDSESQGFLFPVPLISVCLSSLCILCLPTYQSDQNLAVNGPWVLLLSCFISDSITWYQVIAKPHYIFELPVTFFSTLNCQGICSFLVWAVHSPGWDVLMHWENIRWTLAMWLRNFSLILGLKRIQNLTVKAQSDSIPKSIMLLC